MTNRFPIRFRIWITALFCGVILTSSAWAIQAESYNGYLQFSTDNPSFPFFVLAGVLLGLATCYFPRFGLIVLLFFILISTDMPIGQGSGMSRSITVRLEDVILILVSGGWLLNRARTRSLSIIKECPLYFPIMMMTIVIVIATIIGFFQGTVSPLLGFFFALKRLEYFWLFFMILNIMESEKEAKIGIRVLLVVSIVVATIGIAQFFFFPVNELTEGGATATAGFGRANTMGDFLLIIIGVTLGFSVTSENSKFAAFNTALLMFFLLAILLTKSRGAYVSIPPLLLVVYFISRNKRILYAIALGGTLTLMTIAVMKYDFGLLSKLLSKHEEDISSQFTSIADFSTQGTAGDPSMRSRVNAWETSIDQILEYPFFGQGCGAKRLGYADCQYVRELLETGIIGFFVFMYMNAMIFFFMFKLHHNTADSFTKGLTLGFMGSQVGVMVHGVTMSNFYTIFNMETFWFVIACVCVLYYYELKNMESEKEKALANG